MSSRKISLPAAILINLNIIVGSGIFINTVLLAKLAGQYGALTYLIVGLSILPLLVSFARLAHIHRGGSLYTYVATQNPYYAAQSTWSYFIAKLASCAVAIHVCASLLQTIFRPLNTVPTILIDTCILLIFTLLNILESHIGKRIQIFFLAGKLLPIVTVLIVGCIALFMPSLTVTPSFITTPFNLNGIISGIPFVLYAFMGFEASSALSRSLENPERNGWLAISVAYFLGLTITTLFQFFFTFLVPTLNTLTSYLDAFPLLLSRFAFSPQFMHLCTIILHSGIAASAAGVAFGIIYTNSWNLYELFERGHMPSSLTWLSKLYRHVPTYCVIIEGAIILLFLYFSHGNIPLLQQIAACGVVATYFMCTLALLCYESGARKIIPCLGILSCSLLFFSCIRNGYTPFIILIVLILLGSLTLHRTPLPSRQSNAL